MHEMAYVRLWVGNLQDLVDLATGDDIHKFVDFFRMVSNDWWVENQSGLTHKPSVYPSLNWKVV